MLNALALGDIFLLDIETVPQFPTYAQMPDDWKLVWNEKITKTLPDTVSMPDAYTLRAGILAEFGKIVCISTGYFYENAAKEVCLKIKSISGHDETALLESFIQINSKFFQFKKQFHYAGHNIREFDIPYICRRMLINQVPLPEYLYLHGAKPWEVNMVDTMQCWKFGDYKNFISLNLLAKVLNVPTSKTDMDGSMVQHVYYEEGDLQRIVNYCQRDVVVVGNVLLRFKNMPILKEENIVIV